MNPAPADDFPLQILVVDDDPGILAMAEAILRHAGMEVTAAESGESGLSAYCQRYFAGNPFALVVMDLTLPGGMTGVEALEALREVDPGVKVVASSGYFDDSVAPAAKRRGFHGILPKPYGAEQLVKLVQWSTGRTA